MENTKNLVEGLTDEILRVIEVKKVYDELPNNAGVFASALMAKAIEKARKAQASGDILEMIPALEELREFDY